MAAQLESFINKWHRIHNQTARLMAVAPDDKYEWKPCDSGMSLGELMNHIWVSEAGLIEATINGAFPKEWPASVNTTKEMLAAFDKAHTEAAARTATLTDEQLSEEIAPFGPGNELTRLASLNATLEHQIHHRGQLYTYLRLAGCEVPPLFGLETIREFNDC